MERGAIPPHRPVSCTMGEHPQMIRARVKDDACKRTREGKGAGGTSRRPDKVRLVAIV